MRKGAYNKSIDDTTKRLALAGADRVNESKITIFYRAGDIAVSPAQLYLNSRKAAFQYMRGAAQKAVSQRLIFT